MNQKSIEHIALYSLVFGVILVFGILIRQFVLSKGIDDFSSTVAFFATVIVLTALSICQFADNFQSVSATTHRSFSISFLCFSKDER